MFRFKAWWILHSESKIAWRQPTVVKLLPHTSFRGSFHNPFTYLNWLRLIWLLGILALCQIHFYQWILTLMEIVHWPDIDEIPSLSTFFVGKSLFLKCFTKNNSHSLLILFDFKLVFTSFLTFVVFLKHPFNTSVIYPKADFPALSWIKGIPLPGR